MLNVIENEQLIVEVRSFEIPRTWRERFLSIPWEPWISTKMTPSMIPDGDFYMLEGGNTIILVFPDVELVYDINEEICLKHNCFHRNSFQGTGCWTRTSGLFFVRETL